MGKDKKIVSPEEVAVQVLQGQQHEYNESPEVRAGWLSRAVFAWVSPMFGAARRKWKKERLETEEDDLWDVPPWDNTWELTGEFEKLEAKLKKQYKKDRLNEQEMGKLLTKSLWKIIRTRMIYAGILKFVNTGIQFAYPVLLNQILQEVTRASFGQPSEWWVSYGWVALFGLALFLRSLTLQIYEFIAMRCGWQVRSILTTAVYRKTLRMTATARQTMTVGQIVNLMQLDATKIERFVIVFHLLWDGFLQIVGFLALIYFYIGWAVFVSFGVLVIAIPITMTVFIRLIGIQKRIVKITDSRVKLTNEVLQGMLGIKMAAWELKYIEAINVFRGKEVKELKRVMYTLSVGFAFMLSVPTFTAVVALGMYAYNQDRAGLSVDAATLFTAISTFAVLQAPLLLYPNALAQLSEALISRRRLARFFCLDDVEGALEDAPNKQGKAEEDGPEENKRASSRVAVKISDGQFYWGHGDEATKEEHPTPSKESKKQREGQVAVYVPPEDDTLRAADLVLNRPVLDNVEFSATKGSLVAIVGPVGSGKSSLVNAILGELHRSRGHVQVNGSIAYASQTAWIFNDTVRENILFGEPMDEQRYRAVLKACQLMHDLDILEDGDMTVIGERGINLSGGQKQRISVARAAYSRNEIVVLDDPLSALDPEVARKLFKECIVKFLGDRTRILVTNQLYFLPECDKVVVLDAKPDSPGLIVESGRYSQLIKAGLDFSDLMKKFHGKDEGHENDAPGEDKAEADDAGDGETPGDKDDDLRKEEGAELMQEEERNQGAVRLSVYLFYIRAGGYFLFALFMFGFLCNEAATLGNRAWVTFWSEDAAYVDNTLYFYLGGYGLTALAVTFFLFLSLLLNLYFGVVASRNIHTNLVNSVLRAPMSFYDTTPIGRIVSRFSKDIFLVDSELPRILSQAVFLFMAVIFALGTVAYATPWFLVSVPVLFVLYVQILNYYRPLLRSAKRLESISRSPIYSHFGETLTGLSTIRAYGAAKSFMEENSIKVNSNIKCWYLMKAMEGWLGIRLDFLGSILSIIAAALAVFNAERGNLSAGLAGLSLNFAVSLTNFLNGTVTAFAVLEAAANAVERLKFYTEDLPQEAAFKSAKRPSKSWPSKGSIVLRDLKMRYRDNTPLVLNGVSLEIRGGQRVGICGRTGSGKSSLLLALLRLVEPLPLEDGSGPVVIDGVDVSKIGLHDLRSKISIVPQNPVLFSGTVRSNLDPFDQYSDDDIWYALNQCKMQGPVQDCGGLNGEVSEYGENFSQGQRQLLCLARSILTQNRILLLDEATSSVDYETDAVIQETIRESFADCTILTIAHRLNTVIDNDRILVLTNGKVAEFDSPHALLSQPDSMFSGMVNELGPSMAEKLRKAAKNRRVSSKLLRASIRSTG